MKTLPLQHHVVVAVPLIEQLVARLNAETQQAGGIEVDSMVVAVLNQEDVQDCVTMDLVRDRNLQALKAQIKQLADVIKVLVRRTGSETRITQSELDEVAVVKLFLNPNKDGGAWLDAKVETAGGLRLT